MRLTRRLCQPATRSARRWVGCTALRSISRWRPRRCRATPHGRSTAPRSLAAPLCPSAPSLPTAEPRGWTRWPPAAGSFSSLPAQVPALFIYPCWRRGEQPGWKAESHAGIKARRHQLLYLACLDVKFFREVVIGFVAVEVATQPDTTRVHCLNTTGFWQGRHGNGSCDNITCRRQCDVRAPFNTCKCQVEHF